MAKFDLIVDTREKKPLTFDSEYINECISRKLDTGDYSISGYEDKVFIERKASLGEFYANITQKRFWNELDRTRDYQYKFLVLEFDMEDVAMFPYGSGIPKHKWKDLKVSPKYIMSSLSKIQVEYGIHVLFVTNSNNAKIMIERLCRDIYGKL